MINNASGTQNDKIQKSFVDSPLRGDSYTAQEVVTSNLSIDPNGQYVDKKESGYLDSVSTNTPLLDGEVYDTGIIDLNNYTYFGYEIYADRDLSGIAYWYDDELGTNILRPFVINYNSAQNLFSTSTTRLTKYVRFILTNNSGFDLNIFHFRFRLEVNAPAAPLVRTDQQININARAQLVKAIITGFDNNNQSQSVRVNELGILETSSFLLEVARNAVLGVTSFTKIGRKVGINVNAVPQDVWNGELEYTGQPAWGTTPQTLEVFSSSSDDSATGVGARTITLYGLDSNGDRIQFTATLNGLTPVVIPDLLWSRMNYAEVETVGSNEYNAGEIIARWTGDPSRIFMVLPIGVNKTAIGASTVPKGRTRVILGATCSISRASGAAGGANVRFLLREENSVWRAKINEEITTASPFELPQSTFIFLPELTDMRWQIASVSDNATQASCKIPWVEFDV